MKTNFRMTITPKFKVREVLLPWQKDKEKLRQRALEIGKSVHLYMQNYINSHRHRRGGTGNLANSVNFEIINSPSHYGFGIGNVSILNQRAKYWYVIAYGKKQTGEPFIPANGKFVPGSFEGNAPISALAGQGGVEKFNYKDGSKMGMKPGNVIRPIDYIDATWIDLNRKIRYLTQTLRGR